MIKDALEKRYAPFGGIKRVFDAYKAGEITLTEISKKVCVSKTSVSNNLMAVFGVDALKNARAVRRNARGKEKNVQNINAGASAEMTYAEAVACLERGTIDRRGPVGVFDTLIEISSSVIGKPKRVWFSSHSLFKIEGDNGSVRIRYAEPVKESAEYKIDRYRFKITPTPKDKVTAMIFCVNVGGRSSFYLFPFEELTKLKSLNLKFNKHEKSKYAKFLVKVEG